MVKRVRLKLTTCSPLLCAVGLVLSACSQQGSNFLSSPSTSATPPAASAPATPHEPRAALRASTLITMPVESRSGRVLGQVKDIVFDSNGRATHVIVAYGKSGGAGGKLAAIPWWTAVSDIHQGALVLKAKRLEGAPSFQSDSWPDLSNPSWSDSADDYWTIPIDSTSRSRTRRTN